MTRWTNGGYMAAECDVVFTKSIYVNGKKVPGVHKVSIEYDIEKVVTLVTITMTIKKDSLSILPNAITFLTMDGPDNKE